MIIFILVRVTCLCDSMWQRGLYVGESYQAPWDLAGGIHTNDDGEDCDDDDSNDYEGDGNGNIDDTNEKYGYDDWYITYNELIMLMTVISMIRLVCDIECVMCKLNADDDHHHHHVDEYS